MPILWRYLLGQYFKVLILSVVAFIAILLTARLDDIAHFAALGVNADRVLWFTLQQIPYILPIVLPISCLISVVILLQRLSTTHELTAFRSCGLALRDILKPILFAAAFLALLNFYIVSEMATQSHLQTNLFKSELRAINPLLLLNNKQLRRMKGIYFETLGTSKVGEFASDVVIATPGKNKRSMRLMIAKELSNTPEAFDAKGLTTLSSLSSQEEENFDTVMVENIEATTISIEDFSQMLHKKGWSLNDDHLRMSLLLARLNDPILKKEEIASGYSEIIRRISVALAAFTFTLMGAAFGMRISRKSRSRRSTFLVIALAAMYLVAYFVAKGMEQTLFIPAILYLIPHVIIIALSILMLKRVTKGIG